MILAGHDVPWSAWRVATAGQRMPHGWILSGKRGMGKATFALAAARELVAEPGVPQPALHPDVIVLEPLPATDDEEKKRAAGEPYQRKRNISVDQVRTMQARLTTRPTLGSRRVVILDAADDLEPSASNALLKSLEEPPAGTFFLLVTHRLGKLLPTIRSRCRVLAFPQLGADEIDAVLRSEAPEAGEAVRAAAIAAAAGSPGAALEFVELDLGALYATMREIAGKGDRGLALRGKLAEAMGQRPDRRKQLAAIDLARAVLAERMAQTAPAAIPALAQAHADLVRLSAQAPTYNYDPGLLVLEIGGLLASAAVPTAAAHG